MWRPNFLAWLAALLLAIATLAPGAEAASFTDAAGRVVEVPADVKRISPAGPPAAVLLYALAPARMAGWVRPLSAEEKTFLAAPYRDLPVTGRLTGKSRQGSARNAFSSAENDRTQPAIFPGASA